jgi:hypothetical protein
MKINEAKKQEKKTWVKPEVQKEEVKNVEVKSPYRRETTFNRS